MGSGLCSASRWAGGWFQVFLVSVMFCVTSFLVNEFWVSCGVFECLRLTPAWIFFPRKKPRDIRDRGRSLSPSQNKNRRSHLPLQKQRTHKETTYKKAKAIWRNQKPCNKKRRKNNEELGLLASSFGSEQLSCKVGSSKQQLEIPLDVVADIPTKVDSDVTWALAKRSEERKRERNMAMFLLKRWFLQGKGVWKGGKTEVGLIWGLWVVIVCLVYAACLVPEVIWKGKRMGQVFLGLELMLVQQWRVFGFALLCLVEKANLTAILIDILVSVFLSPRVNLGLLRWTSDSWDSTSRAAWDDKVAYVGNKYNSLPWKENEWLWTHGSTPKKQMMVDLGWFDHPRGAWWSSYKAVWGHISHPLKNPRCWSIWQRFLLQAVGQNLGCFFGGLPVIPLWESFTQAWTGCSPG